MTIKDWRKTDTNEWEHSSGKRFVEVVNNGTGAKGWYVRTGLFGRMLSQANIIVKNKTKSKALEYANSNMR